MPEDWSARVLLGDCLEVMKGLEDGSVDAIVTDPPAGIAFLGKSWDSDRGGRKHWIAWLEGVMTEALRVSKPGAHALVWALPRTSHWTGSALEEAGWEVRDVVTHLFGEGYPKSLDLSKAIDRKLGAERTEVIGHKDSGLDKGSGTSVDFSGASGRDESGLIPVTAPATAAATTWDGWGTGLKPSAEFWFLARRPLVGSVAENVLEHGVGALNVAAARVAGVVLATKMPKFGSGKDGSSMLGNRDGAEQVAWEGDVGGRYPANTILSHDPACKGTGPHHSEVLCVDECPVKMLNEQSGESSSASTTPVYKPQDSLYNHSNGGGPGRRVGADDRGGAARFFYVAKPRTREKIAGTVRNLHPTAKSIQLMRYFAKLVTPPGGTILDPFAGSGSTGCAAMLDGFRFIGIEQDPESHETALARISDYAFASGRPRPTT